MNIRQSAGSACVDSRGGLEVTLEGRAQVLLAGKVRAIADPHGQRPRAKACAGLDAVDVVLDGLCAHRRSVCVRLPNLYDSAWPG